MTWKSAARKWLPVLLWMLLIFIGSTNALSGHNTSRFLRPFLHRLFPHLTDAGFAKIHYAIRKAGHISEYAFLAFLMFRATRQQPGPQPLRKMIFLWILCVAFAITDEFHQIFVISRGPSIHDVLFDSFGAALSLCLIQLWCKRSRNEAPPGLAG